ncbi:MAG: hypothetical protein ACI4QW_03520, partial [Clostridia bacterium]
FLGSFIQAMRGKKRDYEVFAFYNKLVMPRDILKVIDERGREYFPQLTDGDIAVLEDYVAQNKFDDHAGFGESAMLMGTYPELVRLDRAEAESGMSTHRTDFLLNNGILWGASWSLNYPNAYSGHPPKGLTQAIADAAVEISVERTANILKILKDDTLMKQIM